MKPIIDVRWKWIWGAVLAFAWTSVVVLFVKSNGNLSVQELLNYQPESTLLALLTMAGLFLLKSVDFLMHSGVLYAANGIMFPLPVALLLNTLGAAIMVTPTYWIGRTMGAPVLRYIAEKHPIIEKVSAISSKREWLTSLLLRACGLPLLPVGLYMGAVNSRYSSYLLGSLIGIFPLMAAYTIMGTSVGDLSSPVFWWALAFNILVCIAAIVILYFLLRKKKDTEGKSL